ncbi:FkbM family methyltransferase [Haloarcula marina]|uniref:FkbM family methyltransferase n=1 Tax=Haloarcula marina TaxID=2961574 RepID=UPI0020B8E1D3|nr:FkbM family methyltransferase [Halomicroarcula marina]
MEVDENWWRLGLTAADMFPYEPTLMELLYDRLNSGDVFYNIGARWGVFSLLASECGVTPTGIHSFEADEDSVELLRRNVDPETHIVHSFVGEGDDDGSVSVDAYSEEHVEPTLMKIDVEGAEGRVIRGSRRTLRDNSPELFIEMHPQKIEAMDDEQGDIISTLESHGYKLEVFLKHRDGNQSVPVTDATLPTDGDYLLWARE